MNIDTFEYILNAYGITLESVYLHSKGYLNGMIESVKFTKEYNKYLFRMTDCGAGTGLTSMLLNKYFNVFSYDVTGQDGSIPFDKGVQQSIWNACGIEGQIDGAYQKITENVFMHAVYEHIANRKEELKNIYDLMQSRGRLFIFRLPQKQSYSERLFGAHKTLLSMGEVIRELVDTGFVIEEVKYTDFMIWSMPTRFLQAIWNWLFPVLNIIDKLALKTPLKRYAHNISIVVRKP